MALVDNKITDTDISTNGVISAPDKLTGTVAQNKALFDKLIKDAVKVKFNSIIDALVATADGASGADQIGATAISGLSGTTLQALLESLQSLAAHLAGDETFTGVKTFSVSPTVPIPTNDGDATPKSYVMPKSDAYTKSEIQAAIDMVKGALASINGISSAGGNITIEDSGSGTIGVTVDAVNKKIKLAAMGTAVPANHATAHEAGGADIVHLANMTYDNTISGLSATNPKAAIDELASEKLDIVNKATQAEAEAGVEDSKFMTALKTKQAVDKFAAPKIGDIVTTMRKDLGSNYLLCNGSGFNKTTYPDLAILVSNNPLGTWTSNTTLSSVEGVSNYTFSYTSPYYIATGTNGMYYSTAANGVGGWTTASAGSNLMVTPTYGNGYWVSGDYNGCIYYSAGSTPTGTWTKAAAITGAPYLTAVAYGNGYWAIAANATGKNLYYNSSTPNTTWTLNNQANTNFMSIAYANGYWVAASQTGIYYKYSVPTGTWNLVPGSGSIYFANARYINGYWVAIGVSGALWYIAGNPNGTWTVNNQGTNTIRNITYDGIGNWFAIGDTTSWHKTGTTPAGAWTSTTSFTGYSDVVYVNDAWVGATAYKTYTVPAISNGAYNYIKAL